ncbi:MAG: hypothetical protein RMJ60_04325 [Anaerolineales bacterium]|nr:hypothetical protein [Anaerolineales bacterium]
MRARHLAALSVAFVIAGCATSTFIEGELVDKTGCKAYWDSSIFKFFEDELGHPKYVTHENLKCVNGLLNGEGPLHFLIDDKQAVLVTQGVFLSGRPVGDHYGRIVGFVSDSLFSNRVVPDVMLAKWSFDNAGLPHGEQIYTGKYMDWIDRCEQGNCTGMLTSIDSDVKKSIRNKSPTLIYTRLPNKSSGDPLLARSSPSIQEPHILRASETAKQSNNSTPNAKSELERLHEQLAALRSLKEGVPESVDTDISRKCFRVHNECGNACLGIAAVEIFASITQKKYPNNAAIDACLKECEQKRINCITSMEAYRKSEERRLLMEYKRHEERILNRIKELRGNTVANKPDDKIQTTYSIHKDNSVQAPQKNTASDNYKYNRYCSMTIREIGVMTYKNFLSRGVDPLKKIENEAGPKGSAELDGRILDIINRVEHGKNIQDTLRDIEREISRYRSNMQQSMQSALDVATDRAAARSRIKSQILPHNFEAEAGFIEAAAQAYWLAALQTNVMIAAYKCLDQGGATRYEFELPTDSLK